MMESEVLIFQAPRQIAIERQILPAPSPQEVQVQTMLTAISPGTEMLVYRGELPEGLAADETLASLEGRLAYPLSYGYCAVGSVTHVGAGVDPSWLGRQVFGFQPHRSRFNARPEDLILLPDDLSPEDSVFLPNMETALGLVMDAAPLPGERVAVIGQGIVGLLTAAVLSTCPLAELVGLERLPLRRKASLEAGVHASLGPEDVTNASHRRYDLVFELSGAPASLDLAIDLAGDDARIVVGSWYGSKRAVVDLGGHFHRGRLKIISSQVSRLAPQHTGRWTKTRRMGFAVEMVRRIRPSRYITHQFPLASAAEAYQLIDRAPGETIQVVLEYV